MPTFKSIANQHQVEAAKRATAAAASGVPEEMERVARDVSEEFLRKVAPLYPKQPFAIDGHVAVELVQNGNGRGLRTSALTDEGKAFMAWVRDEFRKVG